MLRGGFPELYRRPELRPVSYLNDYISTFIEKDIGRSSGIEKIDAFLTLLRLLATRVGQFINFSDLAHGSKVEDAMAANCDSFVALIELFRSLTQERLVPPQVWAMGSEIECHPTFGVPELAAYAQSKRAYARYARNYNRAEDILYRHIVTSAFTSRMGRGLISAKAAAWLSLWLIKRGFRYVPVSYTGVALLNFGLFVAGDRIEAIARLGRSVPASDTTEIGAA